MAELSMNEAIKVLVATATEYLMINGDEGVMDAAEKQRIQGAIDLFKDTPETPLNNLFLEVASAEIQIESVEEVPDPSGKFADVHLEAMKQPDVLGITLALPHEVYDKYGVVVPAA